MGFVIGLLTFFLVLDCVVLTLLVLIQLPKKEAGMGLAFGSAASDALFGAGSGTVLTKITKYSATIFFALALLLAVLQRIYHNRNSSEFLQNLEKAGKPAAGMSAPPVKSATTPLTPAATNQFKLAPEATGATNAPAANSQLSTNSTPPAPLSAPVNSAISNQAPAAVTNTPAPGK